MTTTRRTRSKQTEERGFSEALGYSPFSAYTGDSYAMRLSAVYRCVDVISSSVAQLPFLGYLTAADGTRTRLSTSLISLLNRRPDARMSRYTFIQCIVASMYLRGNAYAIIERGAGREVVNLKYIDSGRVTILHDAVNENVRYLIDGVEYQPHDVLHFMNVTYNGIEGVSTLRAAANTLEIAANTDNTARGFFQGGANVAGLLKIEGIMSDKQKQAMKESWEKAFSPTSGTPGGVAVVEGNVSFEKITMSAADSQLLQAREFNVIEIARYFGVNPVKLFDLSKSSYSTVEATQLSFLTDTLAPLLEKMETEIEYKLFGDDVDVEFDINRLLRADKATQSARLTQLVQGGIMSPNEARAELSLPPVDGGDEVQIQVNMQKLEEDGQEGDKSTGDNPEEGSDIKKSRGLRGYIRQVVGRLGRIF